MQSQKEWLDTTYELFYLHLQIQCQLEMLTLVLVLDPSAWMRLTVLAVKVDSLTAPVVPLLTVPITTQKMLESDVKVCSEITIYVSMV